MTVNATQLGILKDISHNKVSLDDIGEWMREQLVEMILHEPQLVDSVGPTVILTKAGATALTSPVETPNG